MLSSYHHHGIIMLSSECIYWQLRITHSQQCGSQTVAVSKRPLLIAYLSVCLSQRGAAKGAVFMYLDAPTNGKSSLEIPDRRSFVREFVRVRRKGDQ